VINKPVNDIFNNESYQCKVYDKIEIDLKIFLKKLRAGGFKGLWRFVLVISTPQRITKSASCLSESNSNFILRKNLKKKDMTIRQ